MPFSTFDASLEANRVSEFLQNTYRKSGMRVGVVAVSGGIDSAVSVSLLVRALGPEQVHPLLLPYGEQSTEDARMVCSWNNIPEENWLEHDISSSVDELCGRLLIGNDEMVRKGNIMARVRMIVVFDTAKKLQALVCGTENKSEKYLGYFTRFGDEGSDIEPLQHLYKTQVRMMAEHLSIPESVRAKLPTAGLWQGQTDEEELGFSYEDADKVLFRLVDEHPELLAKIYAGQEQLNMTIREVADDVVQKVIQRVASQHFKQEVPFVL